MDTYFKAIMSKQFVHFLQNIPDETITHWKRKNGIDFEPIILGSTATAQVRSSTLIRINSSSYLWR